MKIDSLKDLEKVIKLCRKEGIDTIKIDGIELTLGAKPETKRTPVQIQSKQEQIIEGFGDIHEDMKIPLADLKIPTDELTEEQLMFMSAEPELLNAEQ